MRGRQELFAERERRAGRRVERGELGGESRTERLRERLPGEERARIVLNLRDAGREQRGDRQLALPALLFPSACQFVSRSARGRSRHTAEATTSDREKGGAQLVLQNGVDVFAREPAAAVEADQLDQEREADDDAPRSLDEIERRLRRAARSRAGRRR